MSRKVKGKGIKKEDRIERFVQLVEKKNGRIVKNQSLTVEEFLLKTFDPSDIEEGKELQTVSSGFFSRMFSFGKLENFIEINTIYMLYTDMKYNINSLINKDDSSKKNE